MITQQLRDAKKLASAQFLQRLPSVQAVGIGNKEVDGNDIAIPCVRIYLNKKIQFADISTTITSRIPAEILGVATDIIELDNNSFDPLSRIAVDPTGRPNLPPLDGSFGVVISSGGQNFILGANHVLSLNGLVPAGLPIHANGSVVGSTLDNRFVELKHGVPNLADCALARFTGANAARTMTPDEAITAELGQVVRKVGGINDSKGRIVDIAMDFMAHYSFGSFLLADQILVKVEGGSEFAKDGDSGALIAEDKNNGMAVGIVVASAGKFTAASPVLAALAGLNLRTSTLPSTASSLASTTNYGCPNCGQSASAKPRALLICGKCYQDTKRIIYLSQAGVQSS